MKKIFLAERDASYPVKKLHIGFLPTDNGVSHTSIRMDYHKARRRHFIMKYINNNPPLIQG